MEYINDKNFEKGIYNRARRTLPHGLTIEPVETHDTRTGVWAQTNFSKGLIFGPYQGPGESSAEDWKEFQSSKTSEDLDNQFNERMCNWMIFVNTARNRRETNLEPFFHNGAIFFRTSKSINKVDQLLVSSDVDIINNSEDTDDDGIPGLPTAQEDSCLRMHSFSGRNKEKNYKLSESVPSSSTEILDKQSSVPKDDELDFDLNEYLQQNQIELVEKPVNYNPHNRTEPVCYKGPCPPGKTVRGNEPYMCKQCGARFTHSSALMKHENTHMEDLGRYRCTFCGKVFVQKGSLIKHEEIHTRNQKLAVCKVCYVCFEGQSDLDEHFKVFHSAEVGRAFPCFICGNGFTKVGSLRAHQRLKHPGKFSHKCRFCMKAFRSKAFLNSHEYQHLPDKPFACQFCSFKFSSSSNLVNHIKRTHKEEVESTAMSERESLVCYYCGYTFSVHTQFIKHVKVCKAGLPKGTASPTSSVAEKQVKCSECSMSFLSRISLEGHIKRQHADRPFKCRNCLRCFKFNCNLKRHVLIHMNYPKSPTHDTSVMTWNYKNDNNVYYCNTCKTSFLDEHRFQKHQCRKGPSKSKPILVCPVCRRGFYGKSQHTRHIALCRSGLIRNKTMAYNLKKLPVYCQCCKKAFRNRKELYAHERGCPDKSLLDHYGCALCHKAFLNCSLLKLHLKKLHPDEHRESKLREIKLNMCNACKRSFPCLKGLSRHVNHCPIALGRTTMPNIHSDPNLPNKSFSCKTCSKTFKTITLFKGHRVSCKLKNRSRKMLEVNQGTIQNVNKGVTILKGAQITKRAETAKDANISKGVRTAVLTSRFSCKKCGKKFINGQGLGKHKVYCRPEEPTTTGRRRCSRCLGVFVSRNTFIEHKMVCVAKKGKAVKEVVKQTPVKQNPKRFPCTVCCKSFRQIQGLRRHQRSCMPDITSEADNYPSGSVNPQSGGSNVISCKICGKTFKRIQGLSTHALTCMPNIAGDRYPPTASAVPSTIKSLYACDYCHAPFNKQKALVTHVKNCNTRILQILKKEFMAEIEASKNEPEKVAANDSVMVSNDPFICRKCGTSFEDEGNLVKHDYVCCPEFEFKVFACGKCSATFTEESDLVKHEQVHTRTKNFLCTVCGKTFLNNAGLGKHRKMHKTNTFLRTANQKTTHSGSVAKKRIKCQACGNSFSSPRTLRKHKNLNRCKIYYNCTCCAKNFKSVHAFDDHSEKCKKIRRNLCKICGRGFRVAGFLARHVLKEHGKSLNTNAKCRKNTEKLSTKEVPKLHNNESDAASRKPSISSVATGSRDRHSQGNDSYTCGLCLKKFPTLEAFADHEEAEHLKKSECPVCSQRFRTERELIRHRRCHIDVYPHKCKMCPMRYKFSAHLKRHFSSKHSLRGHNLKKEFRNKTDG